MSEVKEHSESISIIVPMCNNEDTILVAIDSILRQSYDDYEIIIIDDGSIDSSLSLVENVHDSRIRIIRQKNQGVSKARNRGITESNYSIIAFLDADDEWEKEYLNEINRLRIEFPNADVYATSYWVVQPKKKPRRAFVDGNIGGNKSGILHPYFIIASKSDPPIWTGAVAVRKSAIDRVGGFATEINSGEDLLLWAELAIRFNIAYFNEPLSFYNLSVSSVGKGRMVDATDLVGLGLREILKNNGNMNSIGILKYISVWHKMRASTYIRNNFRFSALQETILAIRYNYRSYILYIYLLIILTPFIKTSKMFEVCHNILTIIKNKRI